MLSPHGLQLQHQVFVWTVIQQCQRLLKGGTGQQLRYSKLLLTRCHHFLHFVLQPDFLILQEIHQSLHFLILPLELHQVVSEAVSLKVAFRLLLNSIISNRLCFWLV